MPKLLYFVRNMNPKSSTGFPALRKNIMNNKSESVSQSVFKEFSDSETDVLGPILALRYNDLSK
jgi:hypothetical protein